MDTVRSGKRREGANGNRRVVYVALLPIACWVVRSGGYDLDAGQGSREAERGEGGVRKGKRKGS